jgi:hypothetical protein
MKQKFEIQEDFVPCLNPCKGLYLGTIHDALRLDQALFAGVISIRVGREKFPFSYPKPHANQLNVYVSDNPYSVRALKKQLQGCVTFIKDCLRVGACFIYCQAGTFRWTAAIAAAYMISAHEFGVEYIEFDLHYKFDERFRTILKRYKWYCFDQWVNSL